MISFSFFLQAQWHNCIITCDGSTGEIYWTKIPFIIHIQLPTPIQATNASTSLYIGWTNDPHATFTHWFSARVVLMGEIQSTVNNDGPSRHQHEASPWYNTCRCLQRNYVPREFWSGRDWRCAEIMFALENDKEKSVIAILYSSYHIDGRELCVIWMWKSKRNYWWNLLFKSSFGGFIHLLISII